MGVKITAQGAQGHCVCGFVTKDYKKNFRYPENHLKFATNAIADHYRKAKEARQ